MSSTFSRRRLLVATALLSTLIATPALQQTAVQEVSAATFTVTSLSDDGSAGTLRWAITQANSAAGADTIDFDGSVSGAITLTSNLPSVTDTLTITGPGQSALTIDGANLYRPFTFTFGSNAGKVLTLSGMTLRRGGGGNEGQVIFNSRGTVNATNVTFEDTANTAVFNKEAWSVATYTNCIFRRNGYGIAGDHGGTPSAVSNTDTDYQNRTYVINSTFENNSNAIFNYRFTKVTGSTFTNNGHAANVTGLNRTQIFNSTFVGNTVAVYHDSWTPTTWTTIGRNNRLHDGNTYTNNQTVFYLADGWNNGQESQQWTTITNNTWDGNGTWISAARWNGSSNVTDTVTTVNSANREWIESGNVLVAPTTTTSTTSTTSTTTTTPSTSTSTVAPSVTTTIPVSTTAAPSTSIAASSPDVTVADNGDTTGARSGSTATASTTTSTSSPTTTTTTTIPAPEAPAVSSGEAGLIVDGRATTSTITRRNNSLVVSGAGIEATVYGVSVDGDRIDLDEDGLLRLSSDDRIAVEAAGFQDGEIVDVWMYSTPTRLGELEVSAAGRIEGFFNIPSTLEPGEHRIVLDGPNGQGQDVVLGLGVNVGEVDQSSLVVRLLIIIPVLLAVLVGLIIPTTLRRRRQEEAATL